MRDTRLELRAMLVEARIDDLRREAARLHLVEKVRAARAAEHDSRLHLAKRASWALTSILRMAFLWRRAGRSALTGRERASQPKTRSQSLQAPSGTS